MEFLTARACEFSTALYASLAGYRSEVFVERLGWDLKTTPGFEQDEFDREDTVHVVARDDDGDIVGCGRLLPTTESYLLGSVFPELLNGMAPPCSEQVWELSRFAAMGVNPTNPLGRRHYMAERVLLEAVRFCAGRQVTHLLAVSTPPVERLLQRAGVDVTRLGPPVIRQGQPVIAFVIAVNQRSLEALAQFEAAAAGNQERPASARHAAATTAH
jgi:acyl homoserine lactone synthase